MIEKTFGDVKELISVSRGENPPDLLVKNGEVLDVFSNNTFKGNIWVYKSWIAYVGEKLPPIGEHTTVIDAKSSTLVPGYIDAHGHADIFYNPSTFGAMALARGATTVFADSHDMINTLGLQGFFEVMKKSDSFPVKYLWGLPATYPAYPSVEGGSFYSLYDTWKSLSSHGEFVSLSEVSAYNSVVRNDGNALEKILMAKGLGKKIEGHALGASYDKLNTLACAGLTSCHEAVSEADLRNRVRLGIYAMVRHGSFRSDFEKLCPVIRDLPKDSIMLVSDGLLPDDLCKNGYMDYVLREAINRGISPADAIRMATLNPARYFKLDSEIGSIAPGRIADILFLDDLANPVPRKVVEKGRVVAEEGRLKEDPAPFPNIGATYNPYVFDHVDKQDLLIESRGEDRIPVIEFVDRTVTRRIDLEARLDGAYIVPQRENDIAKVLFSRRDKKKWGRGFVKGMGADIGGIATTTAHDTHGLILVGFNDEDMVLAANEALKMGGGMVLADRGKILYKLSLPIGASMSQSPVSELAGELRKGDAILRKRGSKLGNPLFTITFLTLTTIAELRITISGVYDVKKGRIIF
jgi:adenine deaminase